MRPIYTANQRSDESGITLLLIFVRFLGLYGFGQFFVCQGQSCPHRIAADAWALDTTQNTGLGRDRTPGVVMVPGIFITALVLWSFVDTNQPVILCSIAQVDANKLGSDGGGDGFYLH